MAGQYYGSQTLLAGDAIDARALDPGQAEASTVHLRVRPEPGVFSVVGYSFHYEMQPQRRSRQVQERYSCMQQECTTSYSSSRYGGGSQRTCRSVSSSCTRSRTEYYTVMVQVEVTDDSCRAAVPLAPGLGDMYLVQFDYLGENQCRLQCFLQTPQADGGFQLSPCPRPVAAPH